MVLSYTWYRSHCSCTTLAVSLLPTVQQLLSTTLLVRRYIQYIAKLRYKVRRAFGALHYHVCVFLDVFLFYRMDIVVILVPYPAHIPHCFFFGKENVIKDSIWYMRG
jgi:hypothetical protein